MNELNKCEKKGGEVEVAEEPSSSSAAAALVSSAFKLDNKDLIINEKLLQQLQQQLLEQNQQQQQQQQQQPQQLIPSSNSESIKESAQTELDNQTNYKTAKTNSLNNRISKSNNNENNLFNSATKQVDDKRDEQPDLVQESTSSANSRKLDDGDELDEDENDDDQYVVNDDDEEEDLEVEVEELELIEEKEDIVDEPPTNNDLNRVALRKKKDSNSTTSKRSNELDSIRFSMYNLQNSQINEIDALLSELNQLQDNLDIEPNVNMNANLNLNLNDNFKMNETYFQMYSNNNNHGNNNHNNSNNNSEEIEAIDQQFDEVLKFLAQTIDENTCNLGGGSTGGADLSSASPSSASLSATPNSDTNSDNINHPHGTNGAKKINTDLASGSSSNSSGIGDDFYPTNTNDAYSQQQQHQLMNKNDSLIAKLKKANNNGLMSHANNNNKRNSSDSAFMDTVSMPSSVSLGVINRNVGNNNGNNSQIISNNLQLNNPKSETDLKQNQTEAQKAELIRIALEKLKEANIKKLIVKAYTDDGCAKSVIIDETMKIYDVMLMLFSKNHTKPNVNYCVVEYLPKFHMERIFEDHENLVEAMSNWTRDSDNQILFTEKTDKYELFLKPELYLMNEKSLKKIDDMERNRLINEFFQNIGSPVPEIEGPLYLKTESKKSWKKYYCVLRQSGLYFVPKGKNKKDLQCLFNFDKLDLYYGIDWRREFKAPTDSCFALKYPQVQKKSSKYIKYVCCENSRDMKRWLNGIRIAKFGKQLFENYKKMLELIEMSRLSGRLPVASARRLSASISSAQRPHSSYSLNVNSNDEQQQQQQQQQHNQQQQMTSSMNNNINGIMNYSAEPNSFMRNSSMTLHESTQPNVNLTTSSSSSLLMRKDSNPNLSSSSMRDSTQTINESTNMHRPASKPTLQQPNLSYTDQLKSILHSHQVNNRTQVNENNNSHNSNNSDPWPSVLSPISVSTQLSATKASNDRGSSTTEIIKTSTISNARFADLNAENSLVNKVLEINARMSAAAAAATAYADYSNENVYDLPTPPVELLQPTHAELNDFSSQTLVKPSQTRALLEQSTMNRSSSIGKANSGAVSPPPVPPKPTFKRFISSSNQQQSCDEQQQSIENEIQKLRKRSIETTSNSFRNSTSSNGNVNSTSSSSSSSSNPLLINELSTILARQKKKIEDSMNESELQSNMSLMNRSSENLRQSGLLSLSTANTNTNASTSTLTSTKATSPTLTKKPPPPPRTDRSQLNRRLSNENNSRI